MERRSRSQTRRNEGGVGGPVPAPGPPNGSRHASSSRLAEQQAGLSYRPMDQARTLSPDRRDRYRASQRGDGPTSLPPPRPEHPSGQSSVPHSNSNSYNQYNQQYPQLTNGYGELPPPRPQPPYGGAVAPPRPEPPSGYQPGGHASQPAPQPAPPTSPPAPSPSKPPGEKTGAPPAPAQVVPINRVPYTH